MAMRTTKPKACTLAPWPQRSGRRITWRWMRSPASRVSLFFTGYDSFEAWQKDSLAEQKNASLSAALDRANEADGALLDSTETSAFAYREDQSYNVDIDMPHMRYFEIEVFVIRPGHEKEWDDAVKLVTEAYKKSGIDAHWVIYEEIFGANSGEYLIITPRKSASEIDATFANNSKFMAAMGEDGMKKLSELSRPRSRRRQTIFSSSVQRRATSGTSGLRPIRNSGSRKQ